QHSRPPSLPARRSSDLGLGYEALAARNPRVVLCSISGYGQTGPYAARAGHDINYLGYAGVLDQIGTASSAPALSNVQIGDLLGGDRKSTRLNSSHVKNS